MAGHLAAATARIAFGKIGIGEVEVAHPFGEHHGPVPVVGEQVVLFLEKHRDDRQGLMTHAGDLEPALALAKQNAFAAVPFAAQVHEFEQLEFVVSCAGAMLAHGLFPNSLIGNRLSFFATENFGRAGDGPPALNLGGRCCSGIQIHRLHGAGAGNDWPMIPSAAAGAAAQFNAFFASTPIAPT